MKITDITDITGVTDIIDNGIGKIMVGCAVLCWWGVVWCVLCGVCVCVCVCVEMVLRM